MQIFVVNIPFATTEEELRQLFAPYGSVEAARIVTARDTGRSRGFGFVEMPDTTEAQAAIAGLKGRSVGERTVQVSEAHHREGRERPRRPPRW